METRGARAGRCCISRQRREVTWSLGKDREVTLRAPPAAPADIFPSQRVHMVQGPQNRGLSYPEAFPAEEGKPSETFGVHLGLQHPPGRSDGGRGCLAPWAAVSASVKRVWSARPPPTQSAIRSPPALTAPSVPALARGQPQPSLWPGTHRASPWQVPVAGRGPHLHPSGVAVPQGPGQCPPMQAAAGRRPRRTK